MDAGASSSTWSTQQLAEFVVGVASSASTADAVRRAVQSAAEIMESEVAAVVTRKGVVGSVGFPRNGIPAEQLRDVAAGQRTHVDLAGGRQLRSVAAPLVDPEGSLIVARSGADAFSADERSLLRGMARGLSMALQMLDAIHSERGLREELQRRLDDNTELLTMLQHRHMLMERLSTIQASISSRAPLPEVLDAIVHGAHELLGDEVVALRLLDPDNPGFVRIAAAIGLSDDLVEAIRRTPLDQGSGGRAIMQDRLVIIEHYQAEQHAIPAFQKVGVHCAMAAPVHENGTPIGSIVVASYREHRCYTNTEQDMLTMFARSASLALNDAKAMEEMRHLAYHDSLTGLPNRALFVEQLRRAAANAARSKTSLAVLFVDIDRFKLVNDSLGHNIGDRLLQEVSLRLQGTLRASDLAARLSGDEFAVLLEHSTAAGAATLADALIGAMHEPFMVDDHELSVTASIGVAVDSGETDAESILRNADLAMYRAKLDGRGRHLAYEPVMHTKVRERVLIEGDLRRAVADGSFAVHYQPIVDIATGSTVGVEALVRWCRPDGSVVPPAEFLPVAEDMGLIVPIGREVLREAIRQTVAWQRTIPGASQLHIAVNLSARELYQRDVVQVVLEALAAGNLDPRCLTLEITETSLMLDLQAVRARLRQLRRHGVRIALDDFGTGYSSLSYLRALPINSVKVDRSFVEDIALRSRRSNVGQAIIELGRRLDLEVVAEGVEHAAQLERLRQLHCHLAQGFHFAPPLTAGEATRYIRDHTGTAEDALLAG